MTARSIMLSLITLAAICAASTALAAPYYSSVVLADNPVGYWQLNETSPTDPVVNYGSAGALLNGAHQNFGPAGNQGTVNVSGLINSNSNTAAHFVGADVNPAGVDITGTGLDSVAGGNPFNGEWTIEGWFSRESVQAWSAIFSNNGPSSGISAPLITFNDASNRLGINQSGLNAADISVDLGAAHLGETIYVALTKTGSNTANGGTLSVYASINGAPFLTNSGPNYWTVTPHDDFFIGRHWQTVAQILDGVIDEVAIYNQALTLTQLQNHANAGFAVPEPAAIKMLAVGLAGLFAAVWRSRRPVA